MRKQPNTPPAREVLTEDAGQQSAGRVDPICFSFSAEGIPPLSADSQSVVYGEPTSITNAPVNNRSGSQLTSTSTVFKGWAQAVRELTAETSGFRQAAGVTAGIVTLFAGLAGILLSMGTGFDSERVKAGDASTVGNGDAPRATRSRFRTRRNAIGVLYDAAGGAGSASSSSAGGRRERARLNVAVRMV